MSPKLRGRLAALGALAAVLVVVLVYQSGGDDPAESGPRPSNRAGRGQGQDVPDVPVVDLNLDRLQSAREELPESSRNPFRFRPKPPPPPPPRAATSGPAGPKPDVLAAPPVPTGPPPPPPIPVKFFGLVVMRGQRVATFSDARGNTFYGREGDIIEGRYRVVRIGVDAVDLEYLDGRGRQTIRLTGQ
jgi:hypothetical protein